MVEAVRAAGATALLSSHVITDIEQACDRLIVLGKGHTLLDLSIAEALAHHRVVEGDGRGGGPAVGAEAFVGAFPAPAGEPLDTRPDAGRRRRRHAEPLGRRGDPRGGRHRPSRRRPAPGDRRAAARRRAA